MKTKTYLLTLLIGTSCLTTQAQSAKPAAAPAASISPSHRQAAETLLGLATSAELFNQSIDQVLAMQIKQNPRLQKVEPEMRAFMKKHMGWEALKPEMVNLYVREFTEPELRDIIKFYQTPTGKKMATRLPQLMQAGMEIGQRQVQEHLPELQQMLKDKQESEK